MGDTSAGTVQRRIARLTQRPFGALEAAFYEVVAAPAVRDVVSPAVLQALAAGSPGCVVDVGCGGGMLTQDLARPGRLLLGVDPSAAQIRRLRRTAPLAVGVVASAERLPVASGSVDAVVSSCALKHWSDLAAGIAECARVLRPGGGLVLVEIDRGVERDDLMRFATRTRVPRGLRRLYPAFARRVVVAGTPDPADLAALVRAAGFDSVTSCRVEDQPFFVVTATRAASGGPE